MREEEEEERGGGDEGGRGGEEMDNNSSPLIQIIHLHITQDTMGSLIFYQKVISGKRTLRELPSNIMFPLGLQPQ